MAAWTQAQILTEVRTLLHEPTEMFWSDTELTAWIEFGARAMSNLSLCKSATENVDLTVETIELALSNKFLLIESIVYNKGALTGSGLLRSDLRTFGNEISGTNGVPKYYAIFGGQGTGVVQEVRAFIWPAPDVTAGDLAVTVTGYVMVSDYYTDGTTIKLPDFAQYPVVYFALSLAYTKAGKHQLAAVNMQKFLAEANHYRRDVFDRIGAVDSLDRTKVPDYTSVS